MQDYQYKLLRYFDEAADRYRVYIEPAFIPLARVLISEARVTPGQLVLDLGTGTGIAAREAAHLGCRVTAIDFSHRMAVAARAGSTPGVVQGDMHKLPLPAEQFDVIVALFALNSSEPLVALAEAYRTLKPGGSLILEEWGTTDELSDLLGDTLSAYAVDDPPKDLARRRRDQQERHPWDNLETSDDIVDLMQEAEFREVAVQIRTPEVILPDAEAFTRYKLAWPIRRAEFEAMSPEIQQLCWSDLMENLGAHAEADGRLCWQPNVVLVSGVKAVR